MLANLQANRQIVTHRNSGRISQVSSLEAASRYLQLGKVRWTPIMTLDNRNAAPPEFGEPRARAAADIDHRPYACDHPKDERNHHGRGARSCLLATCKERIVV